MKVITIGRNQENDIAVNDERVSRNHLQIVQDDKGNTSAIDLGSTNGTFVNGQRISGEVRLQPNDEVKIGNTVLPWQSYFTAQQPPLQQSGSQQVSVAKSKRNTWLIATMVTLLLAGGGVYWKISHDQKVKTEQAKQKANDEANAKAEKDAKDKMMTRFNELKSEAEKIKKMGGEIKNFLSEMEQIAVRYPDDQALQNTINNLKKQ